MKKAWPCLTCELTNMECCYLETRRASAVLLNLCTNAIKFTDQGSVSLRVRARAKEDFENVIMEVQDTGIGIAPEKHDTIFGKFVQADSSISRQYGGTVLVWLSAKNGKTMGSTIEIESKPGKGSLFRVTLPMVRTSSSKPDSPRNSYPEKPTGTKTPKILLVEDYTPNILVATSMLENLGYECDVATSGYDALAKLETNGWRRIDGRADARNG